MLKDKVYKNLAHQHGSTQFLSEVLLCFYTGATCTIR